MTTKKQEPAAVETPVAVLPAAEPRRGACVEFVEFCKEQHLTARAAQTFIRVLHNQNWEAECERIKESMRPEIEKLFAPIEQSLASGANCREVLAQLVQTLEKAEK